MKRDDNFFIIEGIDSGQKSAFEWVSESYHDEFTGDYDRDFLSLSLSRKKIFLLFGVIFLGLLILWGKSFYLQAWKGNYYFSLAESNRIRTEYLKASRGIIYDRAGEPLVRNISGFSVEVVPAELPKDANRREGVLQVLAPIASSTIEELAAKIDGANQYYFQPLNIATGLDYEQAMSLKVQENDLPGVHLELDYWREYLGGDAFSHVLGYVGKINENEYRNLKDKYLLSDNIGKAGLESYYEGDLKGEHGREKWEVDALGRKQKIISQSDYISGCDLTLTINAELEKKIYQVLEDRLRGQKGAAVIVSNPQNGEILALVDYPSYDNNLFAKRISQKDYSTLLENDLKPLFNRSILGEYPSGSTVKPVIAIGALEEGIVTPQTAFNSVGGLWVGSQWFFPDWQAGGHGITNLYRAIAWSVNTYFYYIGGGYGDFKGLGVDLIDKYLALFGLGRPTGIDLPGEQSGFIPTPAWKEAVKNEPWYIGDTYHLAIGQGDLLVTPLQVSSYNATIANSGTIYKPHLLKSKTCSGVTTEIKPEIVNQNFVKAENITAVRQGMRQTVLSGSAGSLASLPVTAAGKTGTAQWNSQKMNHAWFNAFAPFDDPSFAITVLVEEGGEGSSIAVPIAREVMNYWFTRGN